MNYYYILFFAILPINAHAYLDPASGSAIAYLLIASITSFIFYSRNIFVLLYSKILQVFSREKNDELEIVFYSEGKQYWNTFYPLVDKFIQNSINVTFLTSAKDDPAFNLKSDYVNVKYIGNEVIASSYLNFLKAKVLITTTPQLNIFTFKRKANIKHYCHIVHAPVDVHTYRKFAFDYFDSIFCSGEHQIKSIRHLEKARSLPKKKLLKTGLLYYDLVKESAEQIDKTTILIAPTWKEYSLLNKCGEQLIQKLLDCTRFNIILRPHPQSFKSFPDVINNITNKFNKNSRFILDKESTGDVSMKRSCLMISDLSGIIWDYIFIQSKPVLLFETPQDLRGFEDTEISHKSWEKELIHNHLETFNENYLDDLVDKVNRLLNNWSNEAFKVIKDESFYNFGKASDIAYKQLIEIVEKL